MAPRLRSRSRSQLSPSKPSARVAVVWAVVRCCRHCCCRGRGYCRGCDCGVCSGCCGRGRGRRSCGRWPLRAFG
eukprot:235725-Lingulodinium_polyedra.AAC.1